MSRPIIHILHLVVTFLAPFPVLAAEPTDWFRDAKWGVMTHYLGAPPSSDGGAELTADAWNAQIDAFDMEGLVKQLASTGTKYCLFTLGQNSGHYCSPNATYDRFVGISPSKCSKRDLIADLAKALRPHGIRLMVYIPSGAPAADPVAVERLGWKWGRADGWPRGGPLTHERLAEFQKKWEAVIREWYLRWGKDVAGWWIDGCYFADDMYRFDDAPNFKTFAAALKAGNPEAIVAFNPGITLPVIAHTRFEEYTAGEVSLKQVPEAIQTCPGRWITRDGARVQYHLLTFLGDSWCRGEKPQLPDERIVEYVRAVNAKDGAITFDVPIEKSGRIPEPFVKQLRTLGNSL
jgi:alpha-L-fucosidase